MSPGRAGNLLASLPARLDAELFETLLQRGGVRIERIVSQGQSSPAEGWYDQAEHEWVLVLQGAGRLEFEDGRVLAMGPGDWVDIPARVKHRVAWTNPDQATVWLAVFWAA
ncbi:cupin domain-containing protein [Azohydromonas aeria]|uniref:cupin domain-containing protein n=1 Tax=Azohydromonas aeria TaxID=2590212 RepID=UPI0012F712EA|nr:cupin domain-containing protein [Azohydromonas aeria]